MITANTDLSLSQFEHIRASLFNYAGIKLNNDKQNLVRSRLTKRLLDLKLANFDEYLSRISADNTEFLQMIDALTTNKTDFFREQQHFDYLKNALLPTLRSRRLRIWSAACSSGEEPYSIAMLLLESVTNIDAFDIKILATDISPTILAKAQRAEYTKEEMNGIRSDLATKYFVQTPQMRFKINERVRKFVRFANLNLMAEWPMSGPFDVIFCRNVMIYFDKPTQGFLVNRFYDLISDGGHLFIGHSESLTGVEHNFDYVRPATYVK